MMSWSLIRQFSLVLIAVFLSQPRHLAYRLSAFVYLNVLILTVHLLIQPNRDPVMNRLEGGAHFFLTLIPAIMMSQMRNDGNITDLNNDLSTGSQVVLFLLVVPYTFVILAIIIYRKFTKSKPKSIDPREDPEGSGILPPLSPTSANAAPQTVVEPVGPPSGASTQRSTIEMHELHPRLVMSQPHHHQDTENEFVQNPIFDGEEEQETREAIE